MNTACTVVRRAFDDLQSLPTGVPAPGIEPPIVLPVGARGARRCGHTLACIKRFV
jgi:hypothetical protein